MTSVQVLGLLRKNWLLPAVVHALTTPFRETKRHFRARPGYQELGHALVSAMLLVQGPAPLCRPDEPGNLAPVPTQAGVSASATMRANSRDPSRVGLPSASSSASRWP